MRARLRRCLYTVDSLKRLTHTVTHTRKRADGSSGNRDVKEYFNSSENDQKRPENDIFRIFLLFVISRSGVRVRLPAPPSDKIAYGGIPEWPKGTDCKSAGNAFDGSNPSSPTKNTDYPFGWSVFFFSGKMESKFIPVRGNPSSPTKNTNYPFGVIGIFLCTKIDKFRKRLVDFTFSLFPHSLLFPFETCRFRESVIVNTHRKRILQRHRNARQMH